jgi:hypothetical protein
MNPKETQTDKACKFINGCIFKELNVEPAAPTEVDHNSCIIVNGESYYLGLRPGLQVFVRVINDELKITLGYHHPIKILNKGVPTGEAWYKNKDRPYSENFQYKAPEGTIFVSYADTIKRPIVCMDLDKGSVTTLQSGTPVDSNSATAQSEQGIQGKNQ